MTKALWAATIFLSAFLVFQIQPLIAKLMLPWFGGAAAVWTTSLVFFQAVLLLGYAYAHALRNWIPTRIQPLIHLGLLGVSLVSLPVHLRPEIHIADPAWRYSDHMIGGGTKSFETLDPGRLFALRPIRCLRIIGQGKHRLWTPRNSEQSNPSSLLGALP